MANAMYEGGRERFLGADIDYDADNIKLGIVDAGVYTKDLVNHDFHDDLSGIIDTSGNLQLKTKAAGVADAADVTLTAVTGNEFEQIIFWMDSGVSSTSPLFLNLDTATGLPTTPNGSDITIEFDSGANKIFKL